MLSFFIHYLPSFFSGSQSQTLCRILVCSRFPAHTTMPGSVHARIAGARENRSPTCRIVGQKRPSLLLLSPPKRGNNDLCRAGVGPVEAQYPPLPYQKPEKKASTMLLSGPVPPGFPG